MATKIWWQPKKGRELDEVSKIELFAVRAGIIKAQQDGQGAAQALEEIEKLLIATGVDLTDSL